jgi:hypothetical protein
MADDFVSETHSTPNLVSESRSMADFVSETHSPANGVGQTDEGGHVDLPHAGAPPSPEAFPIALRSNKVKLPK